MIQKSIFTAFLLLSSFITAFAQEVDIRDEKVYLDDKPILKFEKGDANHYSFYSLKDDEEIVAYKWDNNGTISYLEDDYFILTFPREKVRVESKDRSRIFAGMGLNGRKNMQKMIAWLLKEKVINREGEINADRLSIFHEKYDENIRERTILR